MIGPNIHLLIIDDVMRLKIIFYHLQVLTLNARRDANTTRWGFTVTILRIPFVTYGFVIIRLP